MSTIGSCNIDILTSQVLSHPPPPLTTPLQHCAPQPLHGGAHQRACFRVWVAQQPGAWHDEPAYAVVHHTPPHKDHAHPAHHTSEVQHEGAGASSARRKDETDPESRILHGCLHHEGRRQHDCDCEDDVDYSKHAQQIPPREKAHHPPRAQVPDAVACSRPLRCEGQRRCCCGMCVYIHMYVYL